MVSLSRAEKVSKTYGLGDAQVKALDNVSLEIQPGEFTAIMGPSGSGKSTLLHLLAGLDKANSGSVHFEDQDLASLKDSTLSELRCDKIGFIFQAFNLVSTLTVEENILLPLLITEKKPDQVWFEQVIEILELKERLKHLPSQISGGQQQKVAAARAIITKPKIIFADEPTGNLDSNAAEEIMEFLRSSVDFFNQTVLLATHDPKTASYADRIVFFVDGKIAKESKNTEVNEVLKTVAELYPRKTDKKSVLEITQNFKFSLKDDKLSEQSAEDIHNEGILESAGEFQLSIPRHGEVVSDENEMEITIPRRAIQE